MGWYSPVGRVAGYGFDGSDSIPGREIDMSAFHNLQTESGA
jgi:hypothetical protein